MMGLPVCCNVVDFNRNTCKTNVYKKNVCQVIYGN